MDVENQSGDDSKDLRLRRRFIGWIMFQALAPFVVVVLCWPVAQYLFGVDFAFQKNFVGADLVLVGALLLADIVVELWSEQRKIKRNKRVKLDFCFLSSFALTCLFVLAFGFIKSTSLKIDFPHSKEGGILDHQIPVCVWASIVGGLLALIWSLMVNLYFYRCVLELELEEN